MKTLLVMIVFLCIFQAGCGSDSVAILPISPDKAAQLAAKLANDQCDHLYQKRPFTANQYAAKLQDGTYHWGGLDVGGQKGFSALVTFRQNGGDPHVEVYFSTDVF
jgi:hypothetical protein